MFKFQTGDRVRIIGKRETGKIVNIIDDIALVKYSDGTKKKIAISNLLPPLEEGITLTPAQYDEAVKALMYEAAEDAGDTDQLDGMLEVIGAICAQLKARIFQK